MKKEFVICVYYYFAANRVSLFYEIFAKMDSQSSLDASANKFVPVKNINMDSASRGDIALAREQTAQSLVLFQNITPENCLTVREVGFAVCLALDSALLGKDEAMYLAELNAHNATLAGNTANTLAHATDTQATLLDKKEKELDKKEKEISHLKSQIRSLLLGKCLYEKPATEKYPAMKCTNSNSDHVKAFHSS